MDSLSSSRTTPSRKWKHDVFPSFHGPDVRETFLTHMRKEFKAKAIYLFIDDKIERGESIDAALKEAIRGSKISIVLLSKNYAASSWCLNELVEIMACRKEMDQIVLTIFYGVDPTDVRTQTGAFGKVFEITCISKTEEVVKKWREVLEGVAKIAGEHSSKWPNEAKMIEKNRR